MAQKPFVLVNPPMPAFMGQLAAYEPVNLPCSRPDVTAAVVLGSVGLSNDAIAQLPGLKVIVCLGVGYDGVDLDFCKRQGIAVTNGRNINQDDVADVAIGLMIGVARYFPQGMQALRDGKWAVPLAVPLQRRLAGMKLGVVGMGAIGQAIADRAKAMKMEIAWYGPRPKPDLLHRYEPDLVALATWADVLTIAAPGGKDTEGLVDARVIQALGDQGILVNIARGSVVDEDALLAALKAGRLFGAGLDVFWQEPTPPERWANVGNVMLTPHLGGGTAASVFGATQNALENLRRHFAGEPLFTPL
jgi:lactate dehydrogenase-like 2-hydroxyacid dehydrogenase